jgi:CheY-like chemotaxis protein
VPIPTLRLSLGWVVMAWSFLVVDESAEEAQRTVQQLRAMQPRAEVLVASGGEAALALLEERKLVPSLIFAEFELGDMNGIELLGKIRQQRWLERVPVAMLTRPVPDRHVISCFRLGVCAFLSKPVPAHELRETVRDFARPAVQMAAASVVAGGGGDGMHQSAA